MEVKFLGQLYTVKIWDKEFLGKEVAIDTETTVVPFTQTPDLVTFAAFAGSSVYYVPLSKLNLFINRHYESTWIGMNMPFDVDVIHKKVESKILYEKYDMDLIRDIGIMYKLLHLASAGFVPNRSSLAFLCEKFLGVELKKDERRENFGQFLGAQISDIPEEYLEYGALDVIVTYKVYKKLEEYITRHDTYGTLLSHSIQAKGDLALLHIYKNGIGFDLERKDKWLAEKDKELNRLEKELGDWGLVRGQKGYKEVYRYIVEDLLQLPIPYRYKDLICEKSGDFWRYAETGMIEISGSTVRAEEGMTCHGEPAISSQREDLEPYYNVPFIKSFLDFMEIEKATSFVRDIKTSRVNPRYNLIVNTGRTSCSGPNFQQLPKLGGVREMFKASQGNTFLITDYSAIELATLAQVLYSSYGHSVMRDKLNEGVDLHKYYASVMHGCSIDKVTKEWRQEAKAANFGFPGGLGTKTFIQFSKGYGLSLKEEEAQRMKEVWFESFPEVRDYMKNEAGHVYTLTGRKRGLTTYCAEKNTPFQGLAADGAKLALYNLDKAGFKVVGFVHDEIITEVPKGKEKEMLIIQEKIMIDSMKKVVKNVEIKVESNISEFYTK